MALLLVLSGCGSDEAEPSSSRSEQRAQRAQESNLPTVEPKRAPDPRAPRSRAPVKRNGKTPSPSVSAKPAPFDGTVRYGDGVTLRIERVRQLRLDEQGPGALQGAATSISVRLTNAGRRSLPLATVVAALDYGSPLRVASPVYTDVSRDLAGPVRPGRSVRATYLFLVPLARTESARLTLDLDGKHTAAVFRRG